ncbi:hypothetical protein CE91St46_08120 [Eubacteriales bacterium]|nr:2-hydroxyacyl-CoA dehydratase [Faecalicatena sp. BF-R-105]GKH49701.1 hypothetical protein CE91St46_08120 [Eubacteriales bacterium]GKH62343.1 hypothetical protein CE91St47_08120 [Eubacteriales bacterium]
MSEPVRGSEGHVIFTREMRDTHTILVPMMLPIHFTFIQKLMTSAGYHVEILQNRSHAVIEKGLKFVHNDTCYPALVVIGQMIDALDSGNYDLSKTALIMSQTGGGCRASNYIHLLRKALAKAGYGDLPVISANLSGLEANPGFQVTLPLIRKMIAALVYGDLIMLLANQTRPYEIAQGATERVIERQIERLCAQFEEGRGISNREMRQNLDQVACEFEAVPVNRTPKVRVGIVGEIFVKYSALANNGLESFLAGQGCEVMVPGVLGFMLYSVDARLEDYKLYGGSRFHHMAAGMLMDFFLRMEQTMLGVLKNHPRFVSPAPFQELKEMVSGVIGLGNKMGEGWLLTAEMIELIRHGYGNIVCAQPFGCLPNHICGKGMIHKLRTLYPESNIVAIDYDASATRVNQENRIKLMLAVAREELEKQNKNVPAGAAAR